MPDNTVIIIGNLTADPELKFIPSGSAFVNFTIASTPRVFDKQKQEWGDGEPLFLRASLWRDAAENVAESLTKGTRVIATGKLKQSSWEDKAGNKRYSIDLMVDEIGPSLRFVTAKPVRRELVASGAKAKDPWAGFSEDEAPF